MPPVTIRVMDCRKFGRETLVGTHSIHSLAPLIHQNDTDKGDQNDDQMSTFCESKKLINENK